MRIAWPGKQRRAPAEARRERDLRVLLGEQRIEDQLVERAVEVAAPIEQTFGDRELFVELRDVRSTHARDVRIHRGVGAAARC